MRRASAVLFVVVASVGACAGISAGGCGGDDSATPVNRQDGSTNDATASDAAGADAAPLPGDGASDAAPPLATGQIDRMGRPLINTAAVQAVLPDGGPSDHRQQYNQASSWGAPPSFVAADFDQSLKRLDTIDGVSHWTPDGGTHPLVTPLQTDILVVDPNKSCPDHGSFFDVDLYLLGFYGNTPYQTCGGRTPNDDVVDHFVSMGIGGPAAVRWTPTAAAGGGGDAGDPIGDCVKAPTKPATMTWPYLQPPNTP